MMKKYTINLSQKVSVKSFDEKGEKINDVELTDYKGELRSVGLKEL